MSLLKVAGTTATSGQLYVDSVFSTYLYTGNGSTQTITNGIDLAGKGGLVWIKERNFTDSHQLIDTNRGVGNALSSDLSFANNYSPTGLTNFNSNGFSLGSSSYVNGSYNYASWTFREAPKFFDVVTYTGTGSARTIAHNLGIAPGMIIVKRTDATKDWQVYHRSLTSAAYSMQLNLTDPQASAPTVWNSTAPTSSVFSVGTDSTVNASGGTYVAYLFAHDTSSTGIIQCGSYGGNGSIPGPTVSLGWEPQYILVKRATGVNTNWAVFDVMRGMPVSTTANAMLAPNLSDAEFSSGFVKPNATGFQITNTGGGFNSSGETYIYMAIRRPNKPPTTGTQVYFTDQADGTGASNPPQFVSGFPVDLAWYQGTTGAAARWTPRLTSGYFTESSSTAAEVVSSATKFDYMNGWFNANLSSGYWSWMFKRAPGFFDVVCYTGTSSTVVVTNNLTVAPELIITKNRSSTADWAVCYGFTTTNMGFMFLNSGGAASYDTYANLGVLNSKPTSTSYSLTAGSGLFINNPGSNFVAYLFATLAGISKVGSYTGNGTGQSIACGFGSGGARFVLIKRTDSTGGWYTFDSARGLTSGSSPYLLLNSTAAQVTGNNGVYASSGGFTLGATAITTTNIATATYIFLAVA
jgi:hypothetical protein